MKVFNLNRIFRGALLSVCLSFTCVFSAYADALLTDDQKMIQSLRSFYSTYISNVLANRDAANETLKQQFFVPGLLKQVREMTHKSDADAILRAQDASEKMLSTLQIVPLGNEWFMVVYSGYGKSAAKVEIPVKLTCENGKWLIKYIVPDTQGTEYGDQLLSGNEGRGLAIPVNVPQLKKAFADLVCHPASSKNERAFFDAFPKDWYEFVLTYGFFPPYDGNLYHYYSEHLRAFQSLTTIPQEEYCRRLIALCRDGRWDADGVNYLQEILWTYTESHLPLMLSHLEALETDAFYFWQFFFQTPAKKANHPIPVLYQTIRKELVKHPNLSVEDFDMAFKVSYGRAAFFGSRYPSYKNK